MIERASAFELVLRPGFVSSFLKIITRDAKERFKKAREATSHAVAGADGQQEALRATGNPGPFVRKSFGTSTEEDTKHRHTNTSNDAVERREADVEF